MGKEINQERQNKSKDPSENEFQTRPDERILKSSIKGLLRHEPCAGLQTWMIFGDRGEPGEYALSLTLQ